jgi:hypothetical protein
MRGGSPGVDHALRDPFVIEVRDLLAQMEVIHQSGPATTGLQRIISLSKALTLGRSEKIAVLRRHLADSRRENRLPGGVRSEAPAGARLFFG